MSRLDDLDLFGSGPHRLRMGTWTRAGVRRGFAGLDGEMVLDAGLRSRTIMQQGRLTAPTAAGLADQLERIEQLLDGKLHTLVDNHGRTLDRVMLEAFENTTPLQKGIAFWCEYTLTYRQLP